MPTGIDLHTHSTCSDGVLSAAQLYQEMSEAGLWLAAVSDHDTLEGYRSLRTAGLGDAAPRLIPAIEFDAVRSPELHPWPGDVHILGYGLDPDSDALERVLAQLRDWRRERFLECLERLAAAGAPVADALSNDLDDASVSAGRPHLARALVATGHARDVQDAFDRWLTPGSVGYVPKRGLGPRAAIEAIRAGGGVPVLAHSPGVVDDASRLGPLMDWGLLGLEVYYSGNHRQGEPYPVAEMERVARAHGLLSTGGSDYHGDRMSYRDAHTAGIVPDEAGERLLAAIDGVRAGRV